MDQKSIDPFNWNFVTEVILSLYHTGSIEGHDKKKKQ